MTVGSFNCLGSFNSKAVVDTTVVNIFGARHAGRRVDWGINESDKIPLDPNHEQYISANEAGLIKIYTARKNEELVGYFVLQIYHHMHYNSNKFALCDVIYVKPEHRAGGTGPKLIKYCEEKMKELDVDVIAINTKAHALFDKLLEKMDYQLADLFYSKWIGK